MMIYHRTNERVSWSVEVTDNRVAHPSTSTMLFGSGEDEARAYYEKRAKYLHRGFTVALQRTVVVEASISTRDSVEEFVKPKVAA